MWGWLWSKAGGSWREESAECSSASGLHLFSDFRILPREPPPSPLQRLLRRFENLVLLVYNSYCVSFAYLSYAKHLEGGGASARRPVSQRRIECFESKCHCVAQAKPGLHCLSAQSQEELAPGQQFFTNDFRQGSLKLPTWWKLLLNL